MKASRRKKRHKQITRKSKSLTSRTTVIGLFGRTFFGICINLYFYPSCIQEGKNADPIVFNASSQFPLRRDHVIGWKKKKGSLMKQEGLT